MDSEPDLDDAIAAILGDSDEDDALKKKKKSNVSKRKPARHNKSGKSLTPKALTSSATDEDFYKNLAKISEESSKDDKLDDIVVTEDDAKKRASDLAALDDLDSDLLGTLGKKGSSSLRNKQSKDDVGAKLLLKDLKQKSSTGSLHRKGSITPFQDGESDAVDGHLFSEEDSEDALNSSMNSTRSRSRKSGGSKKSPNKISPRVSFEDVEKETKPKSPEQSQTPKSKEVNFDSDSDLPGLGNNDGESSKTNRKTSSPGKGRRKPKNDDLFGDDDDLPDLEGKPEKRASSALDNLMGNKSKTSTPETKQKTPASLDEFMAKVSTTTKTPVKQGEVRSPRSPTSEETFQFGGYMPSSGSLPGRRSQQNSRPDTASENSSRRAVKFSHDLGLEDDLFGVKKRPSTAPASARKKRDESPDAALGSSLPRQNSRNELLEDKRQNKKIRARKNDSLSPQPSLEGSKSSASGDWLGLGDDVTEEQLNVSLNSSLPREKSPERSSSLSPRQTVAEKAKDDELSKMLNMVPDGSSKNTTEEKSLFPWESGKATPRRRRSKLEQSSTEDPSPLRDDQPVTDRGSSDRTTQIEQPSSTPTTTTNLPPSGSNRKPTPSRQPGEQTSGVPTSRVQTSEMQNFVMQSSGVPTSGVLNSRVLNSGVLNSGVLNSGVLNSGILNSVSSEVLEKQRQEMEVGLREMRNKMQEVENEKYKKEFDMTNKMAELETKIRRLEVENEGHVQTLELTKQRHNDEISALEESHKTRVQSVEESYQRREARNKDDTDTVVAKYKETVRLLEVEKSDVQASNVRKITALETSKLNDIERLNDLHRRSLDELRHEHSLEMTHLKKMKEQEVSATMTAFSHTKSLQGLMEQVLNSTKQVEDLHHIVEVSHKTNQEQRDMSARVKDDYLNQLHDRLLKQQTENDEERNRLQNLVAKMEVHVREQNRRLEEDKWKLSQEESRLGSLRASLEEERRMTREQLEAERVMVQRTREEFLVQQRRLMAEVNEERKTISLERAELTSAQRQMVNTERQKHNTLTKLDVEQESARVRLDEDLATFREQEARLRGEQKEFEQEKRDFASKKQKWEKEKDSIGKMGLELENRSQEIEEINLEAAKVHKEGTKALQTAQQMQLEISTQENELESKVLLLQEKERQIAAERLELVTEKRELEIEKRRGVCPRCSTTVTEENAKWEAPQRSMFTPVSSPLAVSYKSVAEVLPSPSSTNAGVSLTPDLLVNTLGLKRTLRRWSQDKEQDEEFLERESEFLNSLANSRQHTPSARSQYSAPS